MRGDEMPVVTSRPSGRHYQNTTLVTNEPPQRTTNNELIPSVSAEVYHEGYVGGKKFLVPDSNLEAMGTLVNLKMRRRISIRYKHQTSFDLADNISIRQKLNSMVKKIESMHSSDDNSEEFDQWKMSVSTQNEKDRVDDESLSEVQVEVVRSYNLLENNVLSQDDASKKKMPSYLFEEVSERSENSRVGVTRQNTKVSQTKGLRQNSKVFETKALIDGEINRKANSIIKRSSETQATQTICDFPGISKLEELENTNAITDKTKQNEKYTIEDKESLSDLRVHGVHPYEHLGEDGYSQKNASKKKMATSNVFEEESERSKNKGIEVTRQKSKVSKTKGLRQNSKLSQTKVLRQNSNVSETKALIDGEINRKANSIIERSSETEATQMICDLSGILQPGELEKTHSINAKGTLNEKDRVEDNNSLRELQLQDLCAYKFLEELSLSQDNVSKMKMSTSNLFEEVSERSQNKGIERSRQNIKVPQTKLIDLEINAEANSVFDRSSETQVTTQLICDIPGISQSEELEKNYSFPTKGREIYCDSISIYPSIKNESTNYNTASCDNCNAPLSLPMERENKKTGFVIEKLLSNANLSRFFRASQDNKICSITSNNGTVHYNPLETTQAKVIKDSDTTKENEETDSILKLVCNTNPPRISKANTDERYSVSSKKGSVNFDQLKISQAKVMNNSDSALSSDYKTRGACHSQQLTPLKIVIEVDSNSHNNTKACRKSSLRQTNEEVDCKQEESRDCNSSQLFKSRENKGSNYISIKHKELNHDFNKKSKQQDYKKVTRQKMEPINIKLDVEANDSYNSSVYNQEKMPRIRNSFQSNFLGEGGDCTLKRQVVCIEVQTEGSHSGIHNVERTQRDKTCLQSNCLVEDSVFYKTQQMETPKIQNSVELTYFKRPQPKNKNRLFNWLPSISKAKIYKF